MAYTQSRLGFVVMCFVVTLFCFIVLYLPPYEKIVYAKSLVLSQAEADEKRLASGYKGGDDIQRVSCIDDIQENWFVILEIEADDLEPTGIYRCIEEGETGKIEVNTIKVFFERTIKSYGQYYIATLESGEKVFVLINDSLVNVHKKGKIQLPIGMEDFGSIDFKEYGFTDCDGDFWLDTASRFAVGPEMQDLRLIEKLGFVLIWIILTIVLLIIAFANILTGKEEKREDLKEN